MDLEVMVNHRCLKKQGSREQEARNKLEENKHQGDEMQTAGYKDKNPVTGLGKTQV